MPLKRSAVWFTHAARFCAPLASWRDVSRVFSSAAQRRAASVRMNGEHYRGVVLKRSGGTPETRLRQRFFKQFRPTYMYTHTRQKNSAVLKLSYTAFQ